MRHGLLRTIVVHGIVWIVVIVLGVYGVLTAYVGLRQGHYVFFPGSELLTPYDAEGQFEPVTLTTADGERLGAWFVSAPEGGDTAPVILLCHGNAGTRADRWYLLRRLRELGFNSFAFDYRGYADSTGRPTERGTYHDVEAAWLYLTRERGLDPGDIILYGRSLGGAVAAWLAVRESPRALILEGTFTSALDMARAMFPWLPVRLMLRISYDTASRLPSISCPVVVAHARDDLIIPFIHAEQLYAAAREPKSLVPLDGGHCDDSILYQDVFLDVLAGLKDFTKGAVTGNQ